MVADIGRQLAVEGLDAVEGPDVPELDPAHESIQPEQVDHGIRAPQPGQGHGLVGDGALVGRALRQAPIQALQGGAGFAAAQQGDAHLAV